MINHGSQPPSGNNVVELLTPYGARDILQQSLVNQGVNYDLASELVEELPYSTVEKIILKHDL